MRPAPTWRSSGGFCVLAPVASGRTGKANTWRSTSASFAFTVASSASTAASLARVRNGQVIGGANGGNPTVVLRAHPFVTLAKRPFGSKTGFGGFRARL